ncbi:ankyrin repeat protein [Plakobranchus ocellatus]|uniref:Ankyrin repeat protein n=1 Tax=Plakobranchus ocellatus TaxID=259542 RepID=A0AAV4DQB2_9GAST|nr:ankyrin repeat protein [Plakobranchus ocellatus]
MLSATVSKRKDMSQTMRCVSCSKMYAQGVSFSTEVDKEISKFLEKEIQFETSRSNQALPKVPGFEVVADGGDLTFTKTMNSEK